MTFNAEDYMEYLEGYDMSQTEKEEMLYTLRGIIEAVFDEAFGVHPVQQAATKAPIKYVLNALRVV